MFILKVTQSRSEINDSKKLHFDTYIQIFDSISFSISLIYIPKYKTLINCLCLFLANDSMPVELYLPLLQRLKWRTVISKG